MPSSQEIVPQAVAVALPFDEYLAIPALSHSGMKDLAISPLRFWFRNINPDRIPEEPTPEMTFGSAVHCAVLEPDKYDERYICEIDETDFVGCLRTVGDMREWASGRNVKLKGTLKPELIAQVQAIDPNVPILDVELERFQQESAGRIVLKKADWSRVAGCARALAEEPEIIRMLSEGRPEISLFATDPEMGVPLKCRMDWMGANVILDLKTFVCKHGNSVDKSVANAIWFEGYHRQARFYTMVRRLCDPSWRGDFVIAMVESQAPHEVRIRKLGPRHQGMDNVYWQRAEADIRSLIRIYADCMDRWGTAPWIKQQEIDPLIDEDLGGLVFG